MVTAQLLRKFVKKISNNLKKEGTAYGKKEKRPDDD